MLVCSVLALNARLYPLDGLAVESRHAMLLYLRKIAAVFHRTASIAAQNDSSDSEQAMST